MLIYSELQDLLRRKTINSNYAKEENIAKYACTEVKLILYILREANPVLFNRLFKRVINDLEAVQHDLENVRRSNYLF